MHESRSRVCLNTSELYVSKCCFLGAESLCAWHIINSCWLNEYFKNWLSFSILTGQNHKSQIGNRNSFLKKIFTCRSWGKARWISLGMNDLVSCSRPLPRRWSCQAFALALPPTRRAVPTQRWAMAGPPQPADLRANPASALQSHRPDSCAKCLGSLPKWVALGLSSFLT